MKLFSDDVPSSDLTCSYGDMEGSSAFVGIMSCTSIPLRRIANGAAWGPRVRGLD